MIRTELKTTTGDLCGGALRTWTRFVNLRANGRYRIATAYFEELPRTRAAGKGPAEGPSST